MKEHNCGNGTNCDRLCGIYRMLTGKATDDFKTRNEVVYQSVGNNHYRELIQV